MAFGQLNLNAAAWRIECRGIGECHAYGDGDRLHVGLLRDECTSERYWRVSARPDRDQPPTWWMDFSLRTPPELITAVTEALAVDAGTVKAPPPYLRKGRLDEVSAVWQPLADAEWAITSDGGCHRATSPDQMATVTYEPPDSRFHGRDTLSRSWALEALPDPRLGPRWYATSHDETPPHLIAALTAALADLTNPVRTGRLRLTFDAAEREAASVRRQVGAHVFDRAKWSR